VLNLTPGHVVLPRLSRMEQLRAGHPKPGGGRQVPQRDRGHVRPQEIPGDRPKSDQNLTRKEGNDDGQQVTLYDRLW